MLFTTIKPFLLVSLVCLLSSVVTSVKHGPGKPKIIIDNDWSVSSFTLFLQALHAGYDVVGLIGDTADSWALQGTLHALALLEVGNLSCIPVYRGADYPILNTPELFQAWENVYGRLGWEGVFTPENLTYEAEGNDPSSGDPDRISKTAFKEGFPNTTYVQNVTAAEFLIQSVRKYPGDISIFSAGALTNIALAVRLDSSFAQNAKELVIMGGYIDVNLLQVTGSVNQATINNDINLLIDPEGSKIALTAPFPNITIVGNAANQILATQEDLDEIRQSKNPYTSLMYEYYGTSLPYWDETALAVLLQPDVITNSTEAYLDVDISRASPSYGNIHLYQEGLVPRAQKLRKVNVVVGVDGDQVRKQIVEAVRNAPTCDDL